MAISDTDWPRALLEATGSLLSGFFGLMVGVWRFGRSSAIKQQTVKDDYDGKIKQLGSELRVSMAATEKASENRLDLLVDQFRESFEGMRRQFDDHKFYTEKDFLKKEEFKDFREEYREDMRDLKKMISAKD